MKPKYLVTFWTLVVPASGPEWDMYAVIDGEYDGIEGDLVAFGTKEAMEKYAEKLNKEDCHA